MPNHIELINKFYSAFQQKDYTTMNSCYSDDVAFFDPAFELLRGNEVRCMWKMLCTTAKDFSLTFGNINQLDEEYCTCDWVATYTFTKTSRQVVNKARANMRILDGKIVEHSDAFSLHKWSAQALGLTGQLFGWNSFLQRKIKNQAKKRLIDFIQTQ